MTQRYVYEHSERHGFPSEWIGITFSITTFWNGMIAIFAGIISNVTAESMGFGPVAPFVVALLPLVVCGILVVRFVFITFTFLVFIHTSGEDMGGELWQQEE